MKHFADALPEAERPLVVEGEMLPALEMMAGEPVRFELVVGMNAFIREPKRAQALQLISGLMAPGGRLALADTIPRHAQRLSDMLDSTRIEEKLIARFRLAEDRIYNGGVPGMTDWDENQLLADCEYAGFHDSRAQLEYFDEIKVLSDGDLESWFTPSSHYGKLMGENLTETEIETIRCFLSTNFCGKPIPWKRAVCLLNGAFAPL